MKKILFIIISMVWGIILAHADDYNPANPSEPYTRYKVEVSATPYGYTSGNGTYMEDDVVRISTSASSTSYTFSHWTKNGEFYSDEQSFSYTVEPAKTVFVAVYDYTPINPSEPQASNEFRLYLTNNMSTACSFNRASGGKVEADSYVYVSAYKSEAYDFLGWYQNGEKISDALSFNYLMPESNVELLAKFAYNPKNPGDPSSSTDQEDILNQKLGDMDNDGVLDVTDAIAIQNAYLYNETVDKAVADFNGDRSVDVSDAIGVIDNYLNAKVDY